MRYLLYLTIAVWLCLFCLLPKGNTSELSKMYALLQHLTEHTQGRISLSSIVEFLVDHYMSEHSDDTAHDHLPYSKVELTSTLCVIPYSTVLAKAHTLVVPLISVNRLDLYTFFSDRGLFQPPRTNELNTTIW